MATVTVGIPETTFVSSRQPDNNFSFYPLLYTGTDAAFGNCIGFMKINLPALPVSMVESAKLRLTVIVKTGSDASPVAVNRVVGPFSVSSVNYNNMPAFTLTPSAVSITASDLYKTVEIDITTLVNQWLSGTYANEGIALTNADGATLVEFATNNIVYEPYFPKLILTYTSTPVGPSSAICFSYAQLAHIAEQIIMFYPTSIVTVFTNGFSAASITGTPYEVYRSPDGTYGGLFILIDGGQQQAIPLTAISAIYTGDGTVYNPSFNYLTPPEFSEGCDKNIISAIHDYVQVSSEVQLYLSSHVQASGLVYRNEYGMLVLSDAMGNTPVFVPVTTNITAILPLAPTDQKTKPALPTVTSEK